MQIRGEAIVLPTTWSKRGVEEKNQEEQKHLEEYTRDSRREAGVVDSKDPPPRESALWKGPEVGRDVLPGPERVLGWCCRENEST